MQNKIAIYNRTREEFCEVTSKAQAEGYKLFVGDEQVYVLENYEEVDAEMLDLIAHRHLLEDGWRVL